MFRQKGFTLIELLVVIAIIGVLSSVVLASLNNARGKAKDKAIMQELLQLRNTIELTYNDYGSYALAQPGSWYTQNVVGSGQQLCSAIPASAYSADLVKICDNITKINGNDSSNIRGLNYDLYMGVASSTLGNINYFSVMAWLPGVKKFYCVGSSRLNTQTTNTGWTDPSCTYNP